ncbi:MAG: T9SS type A sorting domain-containing protein, partial [Bacteroidetes bacterium]|nr:T9SS type A sorting domain-containing protein [Bacteroidota bacterium]
GDSPNSPDSLILEFKNEYENLWVKAWSISIDELSDNDFKQFYVAVRDTNLITGPRYFYEDFQFRFRNIASLSGNNDHWNIDYVRLDKNRALVEQDTVIRDVAFMYDFPNILDRYSALPWNQFQAGADRFADSISIQIRDNGQVAGVSAGAFPIKVLVSDSLDQDTIYQLGGLNFNPTQEIKSQIFTPNLDFVKPSFEGDSIYINAGMGMEPTSRNLLTSNDTTFSQILFHKVMSYDDGSAERAYGLSGSPNEAKKFAYRFEVAHPDTLAGIQVHFSNIDEDVSNLVFSFFAWDSLEINQALSYEHVIGVIENKTPVYIDMLNGFASFAFDTPILVTDKFYIGWVQTDTRNLQIGFDKNSTKGREHMFIYTSSTWRPSNLSEQGSPMMRAVLDADYPFPTGIREFITTQSSLLKVYPNPSNSILHVEMDEQYDNYTLNLFDYTGKLVLQEENVKQLDMSNLNTGVYFLRTILDGQMFYAKVLKN